MSSEEFLSLVVRGALMRYMEQGDEVDAAAAVARLVAVDMLPQFRQLFKGLQAADVFRDAHCYTEQTHAVLLRHAPSLTAVYERYAHGRGDVGDRLRDRRLLGLDEWQDLMADLGWVDGQFGERLVAWTFAFSRMRVIAEASAFGRARVLQLSYEDFLEALTRVAGAHTARLLRLHTTRGSDSCALP